MSEAERADGLILHQAVLDRDVERVRKIISDKNVNVNAEDENGITALIEACIAGYDDIVEILLSEAGCPAQPSSGFRHSPLRGATVAGQHHIIPILLKAGADPNAVSEGNRTPLMGACFLRKTVEGNHTEISAKCVEALLEDPRTDPTISNDFGETALDLAKVRNYSISIKLVDDAIKKWNA